MHGEVEFPRSTKLWWALKPPSKPARPGGLKPFTGIPDGPTTTPFARVLSIYPTSQPEQRYHAGGFIDDKGEIADVPGLHRAMKALATSIGFASRCHATMPDNDGLPSGYTYLLQFIAHDMTDSLSTLVMDNGKLRPAGANGRLRPLFLDTLYGSSPENQAQAYAVPPETVSQLGGIPRSRLRVGIQQTQPGFQTAYCPYRDLVRATRPDDDVSTLDVKSRWSEPYVADRRNDSHAFISQLTVIFNLLHNHVVGAFDALPASPDKLVDGMRAFLAARAIVTEIYRAIILNDVLPRILDARVLARYVTGKTTLFDGTEGVPIEFRFGAFRFAHSIVRDTYKVNSDEDLETCRNLAFNSQSTPNVLPLTPQWLVDWARFFDTPRMPLSNKSKRIGPHYAGDLRTGSLFPPLSPMDGEGLANRDLISAAYAGLLSVPAMSKTFAGMFAGVVPDFATYQPAMRQWLIDNQFLTQGQGLQSDLDGIVADPPLPFFVLFEAEQAAQGNKLGPVGSIILAETFFGALYGQPTGFEMSGATVQARMAAIAASCFPDRPTDAAALVAHIPEITTMPQLLALLSSIGVFPNLLPSASRQAAEAASISQPMEEAMLDQFTVAKADEEKWGRLVRGWARGVSEFPGVPYDKISVPRSMDELKAQCVLVNIQVHVPAVMKGLVVLQHSEDTLALRLPAKKLVEDAMAEFSKPGTKYFLPFFYETYCGPLKANGKDEMTTFQSLRIGDYSIGQCM